MKIRTSEELTDLLDSDLVWRKKEINHFYLNSKSKTRIDNKSQIRAGISILYAHWEGFIKKASELYLIFVKTKKYKYCDLTSNFLLVNFYSKIKQYEDSKSLSFYSHLLYEINNCNSERASFSTKGVIKTNSNLTSKELEDILVILGFNKKRYELKYNIINLKLVKSRNEIVHGERKIYEFEDFKLLKETIIAIMDDFKNIIENSVILESYKS